MTTNAVPESSADGPKCTQTFQVALLAHRSAQMIVAPVSTKMATA